MPQKPFGALDATLALGLLGSLLRLPWAAPGLQGAGPRHPRSRGAAAVPGIFGPPVASKRGQRGRLFVAQRPSTHCVIFDGNMKAAKELLALGLSVDQVVHDYGDLCQAITDLAHERDAPFAVTEFRTLNRCLDNAIADAVMEFSYQRDSALIKKQSDDANERRGFLMHEMRNSLGSATLAVAALEAGNLQ